MSVSTWIHHLAAVVGVEAHLWYWQPRSKSVTGLHSSKTGLSNGVRPLSSAAMYSACSRPCERARETASECASSAAILFERPFVRHRSTHQGPTHCTSVLLHTITSGTRHSVSTQQPHASLPIRSAVHSAQCMVHSTVVHRVARTRHECPSHCRAPHRCGLAAGASRAGAQPEHPRYGGHPPAALSPATHSASYPAYPTLHPATCRVAWEDLSHAMCCRIS